MQFGMICKNKITTTIGEAYQFERSHGRNSDNDMRYDLNDSICEDELDKHNKRDELRFFDPTSHIIFHQMCKTGMNFLLEWDGVHQ